MRYNVIMKDATDTKPTVPDEAQSGLLPYQTPAIIYEGTINIRAGSPLRPDSPPSNPFETIQ